METINDIVRYIRRRNHGCPLDAEASHSTVEDLLCLADRIEAAYERDIKHLLADVYGVASWIRGLTSTSMARERGVACEEVRSIATKLEVLADKAEVK